MKQHHNNERPESDELAITRPLSQLSDTQLLAQLLAGPAAHTRSKALLREFGGVGAYRKSVSNPEKSLKVVIKCI